MKQQRLDAILLGLRARAVSHLSHRLPHVHASARVTTDAYGQSRSFETHPPLSKPIASQGVVQGSDVIHRARRVSERLRRARYH